MLGMSSGVACRWLSVRLEMLGICIVFGAALFVGVLLPRNAGLAGLALTSALNLTGQTLAPLFTCTQVTYHTKQIPDMSTLSMACLLLAVHTTCPE